MFNATGGDPSYVKNSVPEIVKLLDQPTLAMHWYEWQQGPKPAEENRYVMRIEVFRGILLYIAGVIFPICGELGSPDLLPSYSILTIPLHNTTIILIITHLSVFQHYPKSTYIYIYI